MLPGTSYSTGEGRDKADDELLPLRQVKRRYCNPERN
jgi:hypothetical protein